MLISKQIRITETPAFADDLQKYKNLHGNCPKFDFLGRND
jgi:hypothetical protein